MQSIYNAIEAFVGWYWGIPILIILIGGGIALTAIIGGVQFSRLGFIFKHMLVSIPPKYSVSQIMGYLKGKSSLMIYEKYANLKYKYGNRHFWCRGYYVSTVGRNRRAIEEYIRNQLQEDYTDDQLSIKEFVDPFTGEPVRGGK